MSDDRPPIIGYCTNVHAGATLAEMKANLDRHATTVRELVSPDAELPIGLWLSAGAVRELDSADDVLRLRDWLGDRGLSVFTLNGFPYGDFHSNIVKHDVYHPNWTTTERLDYTLRLIDIVERLLGSTSPGAEGSISTLPIGWRGETESEFAKQRAASNLLVAVDAMDELAQRTGRVVHLDLEPEPGCLLDRAADVAAFFDQYLPDDERVRTHVRICHDICHAAVMSDDQEQALQIYDDAGLSIGKVQVSSAVRVHFTELQEESRQQAYAQLQQFHEPRYLHQTMIRSRTGFTQFYDDLPVALESVEEDRSALQGEWRVHFHVPIFRESFGLIGTTQFEIDTFMKLWQQRRDVQHFEIETYAFDVLPDDLKKQSLAESIANEITWFRNRPELRP